MLCLKIFRRFGNLSTKSERELQTFPDNCDGKWTALWPVSKNHIGKLEKVLDKNQNRWGRKSGHKLRRGRPGAFSRWGGGGGLTHPKIFWWFNKDVTNLMVIGHIEVTDSPPNLPSICDNFPRNHQIKAKISFHFYWLSPNPPVYRGHGGYPNFEMA